MAVEGKIQCPCGRIIERAEDYKFIFLKKEMREIDILCPNDSCYLREIGFIKFDMKNDKPVLNEAVFYPPFVTWNVGQLGKDSMDLMKTQLKDMVTKVIDWKKIQTDMAKRA